MLFLSAYVGQDHGNGTLQVLTHADTCHYMSLIDQHEKIHAMELQIQVAAMIAQGIYWFSHHDCACTTMLFTPSIVTAIMMSCSL